MSIIGLAGLASHRRRPLSSIVRPRLQSLPTILQLGLAHWLALSFTLPANANPTQLDPDFECQRAATGTQDAQRIRGRLYAANGGGSGYRIWAIGSDHVLWISGFTTPGTSRSVLAKFTPFQQVLYGTFVVLPLEVRRPGHMQPVCLVSAEDIRVQPLSK